MARAPIAVLGSGMAGCGAGYALHLAGAEFICYDKNPYYGGHARSIRYDNGFVFDEGVHISFTKHEHVRNLLASNIHGEHEEGVFALDNYWHGHRIAHPVQCNLRALPTDLVIKIITDFIASRTASVQVSSLDGNHSGDKQQSHTYADWLYSVYGKTFAETFPMAYGEKYHTTRMDQLTTEWVGQRMYQPSLEDLLRSALEGPPPKAHYIQGYRYPSKGGFDSYLEGFATKFDLRLNHRLIGLDPRTKLLRFSNGETHRYSAVISSIPLPDLIPMIDGVPHRVLAATRKLAFSTAVFLNIGVDRADLSDAATTYFYDEDIIISRVNLPHMFSPKNAPPGCGAIQAEVYFSDKYKPLTGDPSSLAPVIMQDLHRCGFIKNEDKTLLMDTQVSRYANVIYDLDRASSLAIVHEFLDHMKINYCGRYGNWDHSWTDEAFLSGEQSARDALVNSQSLTASSL